MKTKKNTREKEIPKKKLKIIEEIAELIKSNKSVLFVSIKNLPTSQFQVIKKKLRGKAIIKVVKKNAAIRAIDKIEKGAIKNLKGYLKEDMAIIFSSLDTFKLSAELSENKSKAKAKIGQEVDEDVVIEPGPTELVPGPIISQLGNLGIKFAIEDGKISIKEKKVILKAGEKVDENAADFMNKFDIKPMLVGLEPLVAYDAGEDKIYEDIKVDKEKTLHELKNMYGKALGLAINIAYYCKDTIRFLIGKAGHHENALNRLIKEEKAENTGGKKEDIQKSEENKNQGGN